MSPKLREIERAQVRAAETREVRTGPSAQTRSADPVTLTAATAARRRSRIGTAIDAVPSRAGPGTQAQPRSLTASGLSVKAGEPP